MMDYWFEKEVKNKLVGKHHLSPMFTNTYDIPERLYQYNPQLFVVFNHKTKRYEVHSLETRESFNAVLPFRELDIRSLRWIWQNDIRMHGWDVFKQIEKSDEKREKDKKREFRNWAEDVAKETRTLIAHDAWR